MTRQWTRAGFGLALGLGLVALPQAVADEKKATGSSSATKLPDWSGYARVSEITAEVVRSDETSVTLRLYTLTAKAPKGGQRAQRPQLNRGGFQNPLMRRPQGNRSSQPQVQWEPHDYTVLFAPEGLARTKSPPPKTDENGKKVPYTQKELEELKAPFGAPGYAIARSDLAPGSIVDVILVRDRAIAADKVTESDLRVKYATVVGNAPTPPKDAGNDNDRKKKKN